MKLVQSYQYLTHPLLTPTYVIQTPSTARQGHLHTPPTVTSRAPPDAEHTRHHSFDRHHGHTRERHLARFAHPSPFWAADDPHAQPLIQSYGEGSRIVRYGQAEERRKMDDDEDVRTVIGSHEMEMEMED
jgi:hypothetical protein